MYKITFTFKNMDSILSENGMVATAFNNALGREYPTRKDAAVDENAVKLIANLLNLEDFKSKIVETKEK